MRIADTTKLAPHFVGPCKVLERTGEIEYKLDLPENMQIYDVFMFPC